MNHLPHLILRCTIAVLLVSCSCLNVRATACSSVSLPSVWVSTLTPDAVGRVHVSVNFQGGITSATDQLKGLMSGALENWNFFSCTIQALSWDYLFTDPATHDELKRQTGFSVGKIHVNQKKKLMIRTPSSPPKVINAGSMNANGAPFDEHISIQCILFANGSFWENPESKGISCEKLRSLQRGPVKSSNEIIG